MTIELRATSPDLVEIRISGRFDFSMHREFREVWRQCGPAGSCVVDLERVSYVDSSALGMLLLLREEYDTVSIRNCPAAVRKVFSVARFETLFDFV